MRELGGRQSGETVIARDKACIRQHLADFAGKPKDAVVIEKFLPLEPSNDKPI